MYACKLIPHPKMLEVIMVNDSLELGKGAKSNGFTNRNLEVCEALACGWWLAAEVGQWFIHEFSTSD